MGQRPRESAHFHRQAGDPLEQIDAVARVARSLAGRDLAAITAQELRGAKRSGLSDRRVAALTFASGLRVVYQPRSLGLDAAYGQLLALSVYRRYEEEGEDFVPRYVELLAAGGSKSPEELAAIAGLDLEDPGYWAAGLDLVREQLDAAVAAAAEVSR